MIVWTSSQSMKQSINQSISYHQYRNTFVITEKSCLSTHCLWCVGVIFWDGFFLFQVWMIYHIIVELSVNAQFVKSNCEIIFCYTIVCWSLQNEKESCPFCNYANESIDCSAFMISTLAIDYNWRMFWSGPIYRWLSHTLQPTSKM